MNLTELRTLLDYHYWARDRLLQAVEQLTPEQFTQDICSSFGSVRDTLVHIYSAEWIWYSRWQGKSPAAMLDPKTFQSLAAVRSAWNDHEAKLRAFLNSLGEQGIDNVMPYRTTEGEPKAEIFRHMLQHVVNHASYHRGQVTTMLRQLGASPPKSMDMIAFYRERGNK